ncbi:hypothetical protein J7K70_02775, partial [bacterium]|nr:hypothetical protein [bacterium]
GVLYYYNFRLVKIISEKGNMVRNGSFEIDLDKDGRPEEWNCYLSREAEGEIILDNTNVSKGIKSLKMVHANNKGYVEAYQVVSLEKGKKYTLSLDIKGDLPIDGGFVFGYQVRKNFFKSVIPSPDRFKRVSMSFVCPKLDWEKCPGKLPIKFNLFGAPGTVWIDNIELVEEKEKIPLLELIIPPFCYADEKNLKVNLNINLNSLDGIAIILTVRKKGSEAILLTKRIHTIPTKNIRCHIDISSLPLGDYILTASLVKQKIVLDTVKKNFRKIESY